MLKKLTLDDIQAKIEAAVYLQPAGTTLTIAILTLTNGYTVTGESACLNPDDFDADMGKTIAYNNAESKIWTLEGYLRKESDYQAGLPDATDNATTLIGSTSPAAFGWPGTVNVKLPIVAVPPHDGMTPYLGVKIVNAKPMSRGIYTQLRGWDLPTDEDPADPGYLVEYTDAQRPNVTGFDGYVSWSPADVFHSSYGPVPVAPDAQQAVAAAQADMGKASSDPVGAIAAVNVATDPATDTANAGVAPASGQPAS